MEYAQLNQSLTEAIQVTTHGNVAWDANNFCSAEALTRDGKADQFRVVPLTVTEPPAFDPITQSVMRNGCERVDGIWQYRWEVVELFATQEEKDEAIAADLEAKRIAAIPAFVTMRQACIQLETDGLLDDVEAIVAMLPRVYQIEWQRASTVLRDNPLVEMVRQQQGMTSEQIDALFIAAAAL